MSFSDHVDVTVEVSDPDDPAHRPMRLFFGMAQRSDWRAILSMWMDECKPSDVERYRRLHTNLQRAIYDGTPLESDPTAYVSTSRWPLP